MASRLVVAVSVAGLFLLPLFAAAWRVPEAEAQSRSGIDYTRLIDEAPALRNADGLDASECKGELDKSANPAVVAIDQAFTVTLSLMLACPPSAFPNDVVLVVDRSGSMRGSAMADTRLALREFLDEVDFNLMRVALVTFSTKGEKRVGLSTSRRQLDDAIASIVAEGNTNIGAGINAAGGILGWSKAPRDRLAAIVLLTDGREQFDAEAVLRQSKVLKDDGVHFSTIGLGRDVDEELLAELASSRSDALLAPSGADLSALFRRLAGRLSDISARDIIIDDLLPSDMRYVEGSALPPLAERQGNLLRWRLPFLPSDGISLTYRLRPQLIGMRPANIEAYVEFTDGLGESGREVFPVPMVEVLRVLPSATPTASNTATPTSSPTTTSTPSPTRNAGPGTQTGTPSADQTPIIATPTPDGRATTATPPPPSPIFLPFVSRNGCVAEMRPIDIVMVLDASTTMLDRTEDGRRKLDAALDALRQFSGLLDPERERLALVVFNDEATLVAELSADRADLLAVLPGIMVKAGSRIDLGLIRAGEALDAAEPRSDLRKVVILLTDGRLAGADPSTFPAAAFALKGQGVTIYALGLDPIPEHRDLMRQVASGPSRYVDVGDGSRLGDVYLDIAGTLGCP